MVMVLVNALESPQPHSTLTSDRTESLSEGWARAAVTGVHDIDFDLRS